jgi:antitoxin MazE
VYLHRIYEEGEMKTRLQKWGNSLAVRIPRVIAQEAGLHEDTPVELSLVQGKLVIQPVPREPLTLDELLRGVTAENLHGEWKTGPAIGNESW